MVLQLIRRVRRPVITFGLYLLFAWMAWAMLLITLQYIPARTNVAFLRIKQEVTGMMHYRIAFFAHVYSSMFVLLTGAIQFHPGLRRRFPVLHRWSGRTYVALILFVSGPSGLIMGYYGNGGPVAQTAFCLLAVLWICFTCLGFTRAKLGDISAHKEWMYRSYALTLSAISLRLWKWLLVLLFEPRPMDVYQVVAWLGWMGNLCLAEILILQVRKRKHIVS